MHFHTSCHGNNITFSDDNTVATRASSYYHGMTFSDKPHPPGEIGTFQLLKENKSWSGSIQFGLTNQDPDKISELPPFSDSFTSKGGTWMKKLSEHYQKVGNKIGLMFSNDGSLSLSVNGECVETCDVCGTIDVSEPVWMVIDLVGSVTSLRLIPTETNLIPVEVLARGTQATKAYQEAVVSGTTRIYHTRLMVIGQDCAGKRRFKNTLLGDRLQTDQHVTDAFGTSTECIITSSEGWKSSSRDCENKVQAHKSYTQALVDNIVQKLASSSNTKDNNQSECSNPSLHSNTNLPDEIAEEVEKMLREQRQATENLTQTDRKPSLAVDKNITLGICDFSEDTLDQSLHQVLLSNRAVYIIVFNLSQDLNKQEHSKDQEFTSLEYLDLLLRSIYTYTTPNPPSGKALKQLSPPIFIVGTQKEDLDPDPQTRQKLVEEKFCEIRHYLKDKHYRQHVVNPFYAIGNSLDDSQNKEAVALRKHIECVMSEEPYMSESIPLKWLKFGDAIKKEAEKGTPYLTLEQVKELTLSFGIDSDNDLFTLLHFYHDLGHIIFFGGENCDNKALRDLVILDSKWLMDTLKRVITVLDEKQQWPVHMKAWTKLETQGILEDCLIDHVWSDVIGLKTALIAIMTAFDLLCPLSREHTESKSESVCYYVPSLMKPTTRNLQNQEVFKQGTTDVVFFVDFDGFLPDGVFHRLLARAVHWSQCQGGYVPSLHYRHASLYVNDLHQMELVMSTSHHAKITVVITKHVVVMTTTDDDRKQDELTPSSETCSKVKAFISTALQELKKYYTRPISYSFHIDCPCNTGVPHTLDLDECLSKSILTCASRKPIDTAGIKKQFHSDDGSFKRSSKLASDLSSMTSSGISSTGSFSSVESENILSTVSETDLKIQRKLGAGGFGMVFLATHKHWGDVAVKQLECSSEVLVEAKQMWRTISSPSLVRIMGVIDDPNHSSIIMEYFKHGSLKSFMKFMTDLATLPRRVQMILDIVTGMNYLHTLKSPIIHRDLKCDNVFVGEGFKAKIGDLGLAVNTASVKTRASAEMAGTISHMPPEVLAGTIAKPTKEWDVYSFGITLHEIFSNGKDPWPQLNTFANAKLLSVWVTGGHRPNLEAIPDTMPSDLIDVMKECWDGQSTKRPSFQDLLKQVGEMYTTKYEVNIYQADKVIMDSITQQKQFAEQEKGAGTETGISGVDSDDW